MTLGVLFALDESEVASLRAVEAGPDRVDYLAESIEEIFFESKQDLMAESDKAWDAIHRSLTDGLLSYENGEFPLSHVILGGEILHFDDDYIMVLKKPDEVKAVSDALSAIGERWFSDRFFSIPADDYGQAPDHDDFAYTWEWFQNIRRLFAKAAEQDLYVLFTASQ